LLGLSEDVTDFEITYGRSAQLNEVALLSRSTMEISALVLALIYRTTIQRAGEHCWAMETWR
jgi:hypothetical protein